MGTAPIKPNNSPPTDGGRPLDDGSVIDMAHVTGISAWGGLKKPEGLRWGVQNVDRPFVELDEFFRGPMGFGWFEHVPGLSPRVAVILA